MKLGTKSLLFGVHQFAWHPFTVWLAWVRLYREFPTWRECVCIVVHDWGYWGCSNMDGEEGRNHTELGARIAGRLFGPKYYELVKYHSRHLSRVHQRGPSKLCWPDKFSMIYDPQRFYMMRARASGELTEYIANARESGFISVWENSQAWHRKLVAMLSKLAAEHAKEHTA